MRFSKAAFVILLGGAAGQTPGGGPAVTGHPVTEVRGRIVRVQIPDYGRVPSIHLESGSAEVTHVKLGSMRYLMEQNFNPKVGQVVVVKGYRLPNEVIAISLRIPGENKVVRLRDENGWPMWLAFRRKSNSM